MSSGTSFLTTSLKISDTTKTEFPKLNFWQSDQKISENTAVQILVVFRTL